MKGENEFDPDTGQFRAKPSAALGNQFTGGAALRPTVPIMVRGGAALSPSIPGPRPQIYTVGGQTYRQSGNGFVKVVGSENGIYGANRGYVNPNYGAASYTAGNGGTVSQGANGPLNSLTQSSEAWQQAVPTSASRLGTY